METRKEMVMFLEGTQLGALVGKRVPNLSEAVGSPAPEPQEKMIHRNCLSPRPGPLSSRERGGGGGGGGGGGEDEEEVEVLPGTGTVPESRSAAAALLSAGQQPPAPEPPSSKGQQSSTDTDARQTLNRCCTPFSLPSPPAPLGCLLSILRAPGQAQKRRMGWDGGRRELAGDAGGKRKPVAALVFISLCFAFSKTFAHENKNHNNNPRWLWLQNGSQEGSAAGLDGGRGEGGWWCMPWPPPADPAFYTYMMSHAAATGNLPYPFPSHLPLPYYSHMGIGPPPPPPAAPFSTPLRPLDTFRVLSHPYPRPELLCAFRHPSLYPTPTHGLSSAGGNPCSCLACHSGQSNGLAQRPSGSDFTCSATTRTDSFLTFTPSVLSKATSVSMDQREEVPLTR
ncbi:Homeobox protein XHOX-3 [Egretta garzetta]|uniref:Homeobox protein XHOX-3 n=1 Tax=Egretta garzetta TaxID=188379 RepID=A0A091JW72_EGRGA|nr:Homeobox protein XHOX-3 [Egretta garzetta]